MATGEEARRGPRIDERRIRDGQWWLSTSRGEDPGPLLWGITERMQQQQQWRIDRYRHISRTCQIEQVIMGGRLERQDTIDGVLGTTTSRAGTPIAKNIIEGMQADIYKNQMLPMPVTTRGNYIQQKRAKDLGVFIEGVMYENKWTNLQLRAGLFALYYGTVFIKGFINERGRIGVDLLPPWEVWSDDLESRYGTPRSMFHCYLCDRSVAWEHYVARAKKEDGYYGAKADRMIAIEGAPAERGLWLSVDTSIETQSDMIAIVEAWHLESGPGAGDGRHTVALKGVQGTLVDEEWNGQEQFPIRALRTQTPLSGIFGDSVAWTMLPIQEELDFYDRRIKNALALVALPRIHAQKGSVDLEHINDSEDVPIILWTGSAPPGTLDWQPIHQQVIDVRMYRKQELYEISGGNQLQTNGQLPPGMTEASGKALDTFEDIYSARHAVKHRLLEDFTVEACDLIIDLATRLADSGNDNGYEVKAVGKNWMQKIAWKDVAMDRDDFVLKAFPISWLSRMPSVKFKQLERLLNAQVIDVATFKRLYDMPDLENEMELDMSTNTIVDEMLNDIAFKGKVRSPDEFSDFDYCMRRGRQFYNMLSQQDGFPEERLVMIADFIAEAKKQKDTLAAAEAAKAQAAAPAMGPGPGAPPGNGPMPAVPPPPPGPGAMAA